MREQEPLLTPRMLMGKLALPESKAFNFARVFDAMQGAYERQAKALRAEGEAVPAVMAVTIGAGQPYEATLRCGWMNVRGRAVMAVHEDDAALVSKARDAMAQTGKAQLQRTHTRVISDGGGKERAR